MIRALGLILALALAAPAVVSAQDVPEGATDAPADAGLIGPPLAEDVASPIPGIDYAAWQRTAERSAAISESGTGSTFALERMRNDLTGWRDQFLDAQGMNVARIATVRQQLSALGEPPAAPAIEDPRLVARRAALQEELARLRAPVLLAQEAYAGANGLIAEIDSLMRTRRADALAARGFSPLNPYHWPGIVADLGRLSVSLGKEVRVTFTSASRLQVLKSHLAQVAFSLLAGLLLLVRGRRWSARALGWVARRGGRGAGVWGFVVSLGQLLLPWVGLVLLVEAMRVSGLPGFRLGQVIRAIPGAGAYVIAAAWLADRLFAEGARLPIAADIGEDHCRRAHRLVVALGWFGTLGAVLRAILAAGEIEPVASTAALLPVQILVSVVLFSLGRTFASAPKAPADSGDFADSATFRRGLLLFVGRILVVVAVLGPALTALGFGVAGEALVDPTVRTLGIIGAIMVLQSFTHDLHRFILRREGKASDELMPVLATVVLGLASLPLVVLIWGGRAEDLGEVWARFREGFAIGETRISPTDFLAFVLIFLLGYLITRLLQGFLRSTILPRTRMDEGGRTAVISGVGYVGVVVAALVAITSVGLDLSSLAIVAGALSVGIGFGLQNIVSNFISGIILLVERPISVGDWIEVGDRMGIVKQISVRSTRVETFDRTDVIVPNADLVSGQVVNWTRGSPVGRLILPVSVVYGTEVPRVLAILREIAEAHPMVLLNPPPSVLLYDFGSDTLIFQIRAILRDVNFILSVRSELNAEIARRFFAEGIEIAGMARSNTAPGRTAASAAAMAAAGEEPADHDDELKHAHVTHLADEEDGGLTGTA
ncbi:MAG: DUF3772 domain-containing protein [Rubellimicrobium sp.]|nr:DUF3772 domain-containing protein [Rubellimicrobium sp.]